MSARDEILGRVRAALADVDRDDGPSGGSHAMASEPPDNVPRDYRRAHRTGDLVALFCERAANYRADVRRVETSGLATAVHAVLEEHRARTLAVPADVPDYWLAECGDLDVRRDDPPLPIGVLDDTAATLTGSAVAIAETGTIVLDAGAVQGRRALSLVPDLHVCVVPADRIVADLPAAVAALEPNRPLTWVSGPSATSDIELDRVEGVHGPRTLVVLVVADMPA